MSLDGLKTSRASTKGSISRIKTLIETKTLTPTELECRLGIVESYFKQAMSYQTQIEGLDPADTGRSELEEVFVSTKSKILSQMGHERRSSHSALETTISMPQSINHLPYAKLPRFSGQYSEYKNFMNTFKKRVHSDTTLSKIEKFNHLLNCLTDQALGTVKTFQITEENYDKALERLRERYDNDCLIFLEYISQLFELPKVQKTSAFHLRNLVDNVSAIFNSLQSIGTESEICNAIIIHIAMSKADPESQAKWDEQLQYDKLPKWDQCSEVLSRRCQYLEARESKTIRYDTSKKSVNKPKIVQYDFGERTSLAVTQQPCTFCKDGSHTITSCSNFSRLSIHDRFTNIKKLGLCINCLRKGHNVSKCTSTFKCKVCKQSHHTMLHRPSQSASISTSPEPSTSSSHSSAVVNSAVGREQAQVILATAIVLVKDVSGSFQLGRVLLDSGSQVNMIKEHFARTLGLRTKTKNIEIQGIGMTETKVGCTTQTTVRSRYSPYELSLEFLVSPSITCYQPDPSLNIDNWNLPRNLEFADEQFNRSAAIDMLLGAETFFDLLLVSQIKLGSGLPSLQNTRLGWIVSGKYRSLNNNQRRTCCISSTDSRLDEFVERFWELEAVTGRKSKWTEEQMECEKHFKESVEEVSSGRIMLKLPFKQDPSLLGESYNTAFRRFLSLERRLLKDEALKQSYQEFLQEYEALGHMSLVKNPDLSRPQYFLPHQCVLRPNSSSTKLRVVFDASCRTSSNISLNGILMVGPTIQEDLLIILLRFRLHRFALTADIVKMYRQILVHPDHRRFQYILWRETEKTPIKTYALNTVTYGTSSAPFMAIRCLKYLGDKYESQYKLGAEVLRTDFYVDDLITGADDIETLKRKQNEVISILKSAGLELSKWHSNFSSISTDHIGKDLNINESNVTSTLGIVWNSLDDNFYFSYNPTKVYTSFTKRKILSVASSLFDPLGLLCPIIVKAKIILQRLWMEKIDWDAAIPQSIDTEWRKFMTDLHSIQNIPVPRYCLAPSKKSVQIHGFCDASINAYGCCIYIRTVDCEGSVSVRLLVAKSKVAPSKKKQVPRLELCAAHLLAKLWSKIQHTFQEPNLEVYFWTDSSVVLHWIFTHSSKLSTFVGNRVAEIQEGTSGINWRHVPTELNSADLCSRGCTVEELQNSIWSGGPIFLLQSPEKWPSNPNITLSSEELTMETRKTALVGSNIVDNDLLRIVNNCSSYTNLLHIFAYTLRFISRMKKSKVEKTIVCSPDELEMAFYKITWLEQSNHFAEEIKLLETGKDLKSSLKQLSPFLDTSKGFPVLRVGGRLENSTLPEQSKHPVLLAKNSTLATCLVRHLHRKNFHAGPKALVALLRQKVWIINARHLARKIVNSCVHCVRYRPKLLQQVMGNLPKERITAARPFQRCGVDFCGPIYTYHRVRGKVPYKTYIAVFVCFVSKAVHLEPVSDLTTEAFIAALKRMISRRGLPTDIFCDNATNFVGANSKLTELHTMLFHKTSRDTLVDFCSNEQIYFHFIPPRAPHFGGIWEAAVKVAKGHLLRTLHNTKLSFEELATALCEIEAVMNSRPITALTNNPNDYEALTPGHLLIGSALKAIPEPPDDAPNTCALQYWRRIQNVKTHFWKRWTDEYLQELQQRTKWSSKNPNLEADSMVIIHDDNTPPQRWLLGRIERTIPGKDGNVRVAEIRTPKGIIKRPIHKLAVLPC